jgi:hypothetical protein
MNSVKPLSSVSDQASKMEFANPLLHRSSQPSSMTASLQQPVLAFSKRKPSTLCLRIKFPSSPTLHDRCSSPRARTAPMFGQKFCPQGDNPPQGWGLTLFLTIQVVETGRGENTVWWAGISNQVRWCDRQNGVAGVNHGQILLFVGKLQLTSVMPNRC